MDPAPIADMVGTMVAVVVMLYMRGSHLTSILLPPPMILVFGGTLLTTMATFTMKDFIYVSSRFPKELTARLFDPTEVIDAIVPLFEKAQHEGLLTLEDAAKGIDGAFMCEGLMSAIDGMDPEGLREILGDKVGVKKESDKGAYEWFKQTGGYSPAVGIIGTVVSLVHVLANPPNPETLGPMIASAPVATLQGLFSTNITWLLMSGRLQRIGQLEIVRTEIIAEDLISLQSGANPRQASEHPWSLVPPSQLRGGKEEGVA